MRGDGARGWMQTGERVGMGGGGGGGGTVWVEGNMETKGQGKSFTHICQFRVRCDFNEVVPSSETQWREREIERERKGEE